MGDTTRPRSMVRHNPIFEVDPDSARLLHALGPQLEDGQREGAGAHAPCSCLIEGAQGPRHRAQGEVDGDGVRFEQRLPFPPGQALLLSLSLGRRADCVLVVGLVTDNGGSPAARTGSYVRFHRFAGGQWELERFLEDTAAERRRTRNDGLTGERLAAPLDHGATPTASNSAEGPRIGTR